MSDAPESTRPPRRLARINPSANCVLIDTTTYQMIGMAEPVRQFLLLLGLKQALLLGPSPAETYRALQAGLIPEPRGAPEPRVKRVDRWRCAVAHALANDIARRANPRASQRGVERAAAELLPAIEPRVAAMPDETIRALRLVEEVIAYKRRLFPRPTDAAPVSLLAVAGIEPDWGQAPVITENTDGVDNGRDRGMAA